MGGGGGGGGGGGIKFKKKGTKLYKNIKCIEA